VERRRERSEEGIDVVFASFWIEKHDMSWFCFVLAGKAIGLFFADALAGVMEDRGAWVDHAGEANVEDLIYPISINKSRLEEPTTLTHSI
jgi:hypothetical protein